MVDALALTEYVVGTIADTAIENEKYFCELDSVVGDGDFGYSLARGFEKLRDSWDDLDRSSVGAFLQKTAMVLTSRIGGTSGPIWGTAFLRSALVAKKAEAITGDTVVAMLRSAAEGIMARGGASLGEKTLLDSLVPMTDEIARQVDAGASPRDVCAAAAKAADEAAEATASMQAQRGRAAYTGERSVGSVDAGAKAVAVLMQAVADSWPKE